MSSVTGSRRFRRIGIISGILIVLLVLWFTGLLATVKPASSAESLQAVMEGGTAFDKVKFVDGIWESKVIPTVEKDSVDIGTLLASIGKDPEEAAREYGNNVGGADNYLVQFAGRVVNVDTKSLTGTVTVDVQDGGKSLPVKIQIGPIILGTALRDAVKFITFEQFTNQMQYGGVSDELNSRVSQLVISRIDLKTLLGKGISVKGAYTYDSTNPKDILVTPVIVGVE